MSPIYLKAQEISCRLGQRLLFEIEEITVARGDRIGLTGPNGCGKSTLAAFLAGEASPAQGQVQRLAPVSYVPQFSNPSRPCSGGEAARQRLNSAVFSPDTLLILDEPSAHLDLAGQRLLAQRLTGALTFLIVSHDRDFLNAQCTKIWYLEDGRLTVYPCNYEAFARFQAQRLETQRRAYAQRQQEAERLRAAALALGQKAQGVRKAPSRMGNSEARLHKRGKGAAATARLDQARKAIESRLAHLPQAERPRQALPIQLDFSLTQPPETQYVIKANRLTFGYDRPLVENASFWVPNGVKTALMGPNGCGKTTLLHLLLTGHPALRVTPKARLGLLSQDFGTLAMERTVLENALQGAVQEQAVVRTVLARLLFTRESLRQPAATLSGGEKLKLCLCQLICGPANVLLLDEPTNYLDLPSRQAMEEVVAAYPGTVLMVCHDAAFLRRTAQRLLIIENRRLIAFEGPLAAYENRQSPQVSQESLNKTLMQMRMAQLIAQLAAAPEKDKPALEAAYAQCADRLRTLGPGKD